MAENEKGPLIWRFYREGHHQPTRKGGNRRKACSDERERRHFGRGSSVKGIVRTGRKLKSEIEKKGKRKTQTWLTRRGDLSKNFKSEKKQA